jgi:hypothetical protein
MQHDLTFGIPAFRLSTPRASQRRPYLFAMPSHLFGVSLALQRADMEVVTGGNEPSPLARAVNGAGALASASGGVATGAGAAIEQ